MELNQKDEILSKTLRIQLSDKQDFDARQFVPKYIVEFERVACTIPITNFTYFPFFRIDPRTCQMISRDSF
jgi:hypothetical protein